MNTTDNNLKFNKQAREYVPKNKIPDYENIKFNLQAKEFKPKTKENFIVGSLDDSDDENQEPINTNQIKKSNLNNEINQNNSKISSNNINTTNTNNANDEFDLDELIANGFEEDIEESDDERNWFPKYKACECCKGYVYNCKGNMCSNFGYCYCMAKEEFDPDI